jgi:hypothetical protein
MPRRFSSKDVNLSNVQPANVVSSSSISSDHLSPTDRLLSRLNEKQLAQRWGVSVRTLQAARVKGSGVQFIRIGRAVRYRLEDVLAYEEARLRTNTSETV